MGLMSWFNIKNKKESSTDQNSKDKSVVQTVVDRNNDARKMILDQSYDMLNRLKIFSGFFYKSDLIKDIVDQTDFINDIFSKNTNLNYRKLEQFHYYYTENLVSVLSKLKKQREEILIILNEQLDRTQDKLNRLGNTKISTNDIKKWTVTVSDYLVNVYRHLCDPNKFLESNIKIPKLENIDLWYNLSDDEYDKLSDIGDDIYSCSQCIIQKRLMGKLNKNVFIIEWKAELRSNYDLIHLFQIKNTSDWFLWIPSKKQFKLIESTIILHYIVPNRSSKLITQKSDNRLKEEIERIKSEISQAKMINNPDLDNTLEQYLGKIRNQDLLTGLNEIDVDRKFLEDILKLEQFNI